ncbi:hypothetical protein [Delftia sp. 60]|uniref:hypothetical protein n=1 Tax=Delftia sp. 60 TaxID=2035216 RepID=UPI00211EC10E|nr:hypothetical protein [Delftia sp. 60]
MLEAIKSKAWQAGALVLAALLALQTWRLYGEQLAHQRLIAVQAQQVAGQAVAGLTLERKLATAESTHATKTQEASDAFTQVRPARDAVVRADLDRVERLRLAAERSAATARAQAQANAAASRDLGRPRSARYKRGSSGCRTPSGSCKARRRGSADAHTDGRRPQIASALDQTTTSY